jgi:NAD(P)-dependent dehydrogenase (short-subunit alcohol dehydrogenase family)
MANGALSDRIAIVTGAAGMIGAASAGLLAARGARIVAVDRPGVDWSALDARGDFLKIEADVTDEASVRRYVAETLSAFGRIDFFFNNAGIEGPHAALADYPLESFRRTLDVNVVGVFLGLKAVLPVMMAQSAGSIVNTSSIAGLVGAANMAGYIASKHAVLGLTKVAALEGGPYGVRVNAIHPGFIESRMLSEIATSMGVAASGLAGAVPSGRLGRVEEVAGVVAFLASDDSSYMNGSGVVVDGGLVAA